MESGTHGKGGRFRILDIKGGKDALEKHPTSFGIIVMSVGNNT
jgi:hypothetical protein